MAAHGRIGVDLERYHARKLRPHIVAGMYVSDGANSKPQRLTRDEYSRKLKLRGTSRSSAKSKAGETKVKASGAVVHYQPLRCVGLPNANDIARRERRVKARAS